MAARFFLGRSVKGSEECFDFNCSTCLKKKSVRKAEYYCPECNVYFCKSCLGDDKCTHDVLGRGSVDKWGTPMQLVSFDTCKRHTWNEVQLYCPRQGVVCCSTCNPAGHNATESNEKIQIQRLEKEVEQTRNRLLQLQTLNKVQAEEIIAVTGDNNATQKRITQLQSLSKEQAGQIRDLTDDKTAAKDGMEQLQRQSENQARHIEAITSHLNGANDELKKYQAELDGCYLREGHLNEQLRKQKGITKEFQKELQNVGGKDNELKKLQKEYKYLKSRIEQLQNLSESYAQQIEATTTHLNGANDEIKKYQTELDGCYLREELIEQLRKQKGITKEFQKELGGKDHELKELQKEYKYLQERFEKMAHNNLGYQNRPTKIAERYSTLYNEAWTDAWSDQTDIDIPEEQATENLLQVLKDCYKYCTEQAERQYEQLSNILLNPVMSLDMIKPVRQGASLSKDTSDTTLRELRKEISLRATEQVKNEFWEHMTKVHRRKKWLAGSKVYILQCAEICWAMVLNLSPLYMEFDVKLGTKVDRNFYTKRSSGNMVKQLVWPALFNGKGGGLLAKGVVEAVKTIK